MSIKISELPQATSVGSSDIVPIVQGGTTKQATAGMISPTKDTMQFWLTAGSTFNVSTGAFAPIIYDNITILNGEAFATFSNGNITFTKSGVYIVAINVAYNSNTSGSRYHDFLRMWDTRGIVSASSVSVSGLRTNLTGAAIFIVTEDDITNNHNVYEHRAYQTSGSTLGLAANGTLVQIIRMSDYVEPQSLNTLNTTRLMNTGSLVGLGDKAEVTDETLEKTKLDETTEVKEVEPTEEIEESGDKGE